MREKDRKRERDRKTERRMYKERKKEAKCCINNKDVTDRQSEL